MIADLFSALQGEHDQAWELLNALTGGAGDDPPGPEQRQRRSRELVSLLASHELSEELVVWPAVQRLCADGADVVKVALQQERDFKRALNELSSISPSEEFDECVNTVAAQARAHFSYEQNQAWPRLSDALSTGEREALAARWQEARTRVTSKPHPHIPPDPRTLGLLMPFLQRADRLAGLLKPRI